MITLREGIAPPSGYALLGTTAVVMKRPNGSVVSITLNLYQKN